jgi:hypothetical protein
MIIEQANYVETRTIDEAWREAMWLCVRKGYYFVVKGKTGSYIGQIRRQLATVKIKILEPWRGFDSSNLPPNVPPPTTNDDIDNYFLTKLVEDEIGKNEQYTYGQYIKPQLPRIIEMLIESRGNTNQACITVGDETSVNLADPPLFKMR